MAATIQRICLGCRSAHLLCSPPRLTLASGGRRTFLPKHVRPTLAAIAMRKKRPNAVTPTPRSSFLEWNYSAEVLAFAARLGETLPEAPLRQVFTERSYLQQAAAERQRLGLPETEESVDNEPLAARGRAELASHTAGQLRTVLPLLPEEGVRAASAHLTSDASLAQLAAGIGMKDLILAQEEPPSEGALVRCLEAFVGALAESDCPERASLFVRDFVVSRLAVENISNMWHIEEPLAVLEEVLHRCGRGPPEPRLLRSAGPESLLAVYVVGVYSDRRLLGSAPGDSVAEAVALAARVCLDQLAGIGEDCPAPDLAAAVPRHTPSATLAEWRPL